MTSTELFHGHPLNSHTNPVKQTYYYYHSHLQGKELILRKVKQMKTSWGYVYTAELGRYKSHLECLKYHSATHLQYSNSIQRALEC